MKKVIVYTLLLMIPFISIAQQNAINPVINDKSFVETYGVAPDEATNEQLRIRTHLSYVEEKLRATKVEGLTETQLKNREAVLDLLKEYYLAGSFPVNVAYRDERRPCFIDDKGTICAVGYLIEKTSGRDVAEAINREHQYDYLADMKEEVIDNWAATNGLTIEECAMIQPTYGPSDPTVVYGDIKPGYLAGSGIATGISVAMNIANLTRLGRSNPTLGYLGLVAGAGQVILGAANLKKTTRVPNWGSDLITSYRRQNNLSYANIALGTTTMVTSALNLILNKKTAGTKNAFNLYSEPNYSNSMTMGFSFTRSI